MTIKPPHRSGTPRARPLHADALGTGVGSDLDLVVILSECGEPPLRRGLAFDTIRGFPVPVDLLVYTHDEWRRLEADEAPFVRRLRAEVAWMA